MLDNISQRRNQNKYGDIRNEYEKNGGIIVRTERDLFSVLIRTLKTEPHDSVGFLSFKREVLV